MLPELSHLQDEEEIREHECWRDTQELKCVWGTSIGVPELLRFTDNY